MNGGGIFIYSNGNTYSGGGGGVGGWMVVHTPLTRSVDFDMDPTTDAVALACTHASLTMALFLAIAMCSCSPVHLEASVARPNVLKS